MVAVSLLLTPLGYTGWFYTRSRWRRAAGGSGRRTRCTHGPRPGRRARKLKEMRLFHWSITYVSLLFVAVAVDPFLH